MTDHKYVFQGPVGQMQLSHCQVWVQGVVDKLSLEDCEVQVNGIVKQLDETRKLEKELARVRNENLDTIGALRDKVEVLESVNKELARKLATATREIESGKTFSFERQMDAFATIMASFPFTPTNKLAKEFDVSPHRIIHNAELCGVEKSTELRAEAKDYLARQGLKLDDDRGGDQGNHFMRPVEKVARNGRVVATYKSVSEAAEMNNLSPNAINDHCRGNVKGYSKAGYKYRYKKQ